jgi:uncharacterized repeat protein (TIGR03847 family)
VSDSFQLGAADHFTAGTVGVPGQRVFYLQARERRRLVTLKCEKEQVAALAEYLAGLIEKLPKGAVEGEAAKGAALLEPIEPAWAVGSIGVGYDEASRRIVVLANEQVEEEEEGAPAAPEPATARFAITKAQASAFVERARTLVKAGRATCSMCGEPKDPAGHVCPRANGHVVHKE